MKLALYSDLHLEHFPNGRSLEAGAADVIVLAGDIHQGTAGLSWAKQEFPNQQIIYVPGNHEYYQQVMTELRDEMASTARQLGIILLDNRSVIVDGVQFLGTTLWSDLALYDADKGFDRELSYAQIGSRVPDFRLIEQPLEQCFTPDESIRLHNEALCWLNAELVKPFAGKRVVISHHAPLAESIPEQYRGDLLSPAFASDLSGFMGQMDLWLHGHVHEPVDEVVDGTRVVANPGGYPDEFIPPKFLSDLLIQL